MATISFPSSLDSEAPALSLHHRSPGWYQIVLGVVTIAQMCGAVGFSQNRDHDSVVSIGSFENAVAFAVDPDDNVYVLDAATNELLKLSVNGRILAKVGGYGWTQDEFDQPKDVIAPNGLDVYVADYGNHRVQHFDRNLNFVSSFSTRDDPQTETPFGYPKSVALSRSGELFITDGENKRVLKTGASNDVEGILGDVRAGKGMLRLPERVRVSESDNVYVQDGNAIVVFDFFGNYLRDIGEHYFDHLRTFTLGEQLLVAVDSCTIRKFSLRAEQVLAESDVPQIGELDYCDILDLAVRDDTLFVLSRHRVSLILPASLWNIGN